MNFEVGSAENTPYLYERRMTSEIHLTMSSATLLFTYLITKVNTSSEAFVNNCGIERSCLKVPIGIGFLLSPLL